MESANKIIKGNLNLIVLRLLYNHSWLYGYEIRKAAQKASQKQIAITEAALYTTLHQLEQEGLVTVRLEEVEGRVRKYYKLNRKGRQSAEKELARFEQSISALRKVLRFKIA